MATDVTMPSLFADPSIVQDRDEAAEQLSRVIPGLDSEEVRRLLEDRSRRFVWIRRGLSPKLAQDVHDLGLPGLAFRFELRRAYPLGRLAGHALGHVNVDNKGVAGIERYLDETVGVEAVNGATQTSAPSVRLALDVGVQHALEDELEGATRRFEAKGAAGVIMNVRTGEVRAAASLPEIDPAFPGKAGETASLDKVAGGAFELGSIWKAMTIALALESGTATLDRIVDVTQPLSAGRFTIKDMHPLNRPLTVAEVFINSSNVGAGLLALEAGAVRQRTLLERLGATDRMRTETGPVAAPLLPARIERAEQITLSYGHGIAVAPIQFAAAAAALINGGERVTPTFLARDGAVPGERKRAVSAATSARINELMRRNVTDPAGTGKRADVPGYRVGGKTGTAEIPMKGGYSDKAVISSFLAAFPMDAPEYLVLVSLFEPNGTSETNGEILAGLNAAPTAGQVIARVAPLLGVMPRDSVAAVSD
jgi:cell division protein FtsI (penicillin-binding protein 3)